MTKYIIIIVSLLISINSISQTSGQNINKDLDKLIGKWKAIILRLSDNNNSTKPIQINLTDPKSIKYFTDTVWYDGLYRKAKSEIEAKGDTSLKTKMLMVQMSNLFKDMDSTYITFNLDSTYSLNNQLTLFGFMANKTVFKTIEGRKYFYRGQSLSFNVAEDDNRDFVIIKLTNDTLIIDVGWRWNVNSSPIKEITFKKQ